MLGIRHRNKNKRRRLHIACCRLFCLLDGSKPLSLRSPEQPLPPTKTSAYAFSKAQPIRTTHCESQSNHNTLKINTIQYSLKTRLLCIANKASLHRKQGFF